MRTKGKPPGDRGLKPAEASRVQHLLLLWMLLLLMSACLGVDLSEGTEAEVLVGLIIRVVADETTAVRVKILQANKGRGKADISTESVWLPSSRSRRVDRFNRDRGTSFNQRSQLNRQIQKGQLNLSP